MTDGEAFPGSQGPEPFDNGKVFWKLDTVELTEVGGITILLYNERTNVVTAHGYLTVNDLVFNNGKYTETELNAMTKAEILELAENLVLELDTTESNTKAEIIADFLAKQG